MKAMEIIGAGGIEVIGVPLELKDFVKHSQLATVATTGSYNDLQDLPELTGITQEEFDEIFNDW